MLNRRILVVDDNEEIHADFKKVLTPKKSNLNSELATLDNLVFSPKSGDSPTKQDIKTDAEVEYTIDSALQGTQALEMVKEANQLGKPYALVFVDVRMPPGWDGVRTVQEIWAVSPFTEMILCTAFSNYSSEELTKSLGVSHRLLFLKKPFDPVEVRQMALAVTTKWNLEVETRDHTKKLEEAVQSRTAELQMSVKELAALNQQLDMNLQRLTNTQIHLMEAGKLAAIGDMAAGVAHEINNPLCILEIRVGQLLGYIPNVEADPEVSKCASSIENTIFRISKIVNSLRSYSRDPSQDVFLPTPFNSIIERSITFSMERMKSHGVDLRLPEVPDDLIVECRSVEISQVLSSLISNSFDAIAGQSEKWIEVGVSSTDTEVNLSVTDSGTGIPPEVQTRLFQPFFTTKETGKGAGLGLCAARGIAEAHRGMLNLEPAYKNTRFTLTLPKAQTRR